ncbi:MAG: hemolysin family protein [Anaerolineae bacterium]|jgi:putative hemolysin|nr:hemolysin family protein [Anaerolineae bacterium]
MEILIIIFFTLINGVLAMSEAAIISSRKARLTQRAERGDTGAKIALELSQNPNRFLSTVQIGITLIGILAGAFGGATIAEDLGAQLAQIEFLSPYSDVLAVFLVVLLTTYLSLIIGELVPKRIAIQNPENIARIVAPAMRFISKATYPLVWFLSLSTDIVLSLLRVKATDNSAVTEEEIHVMIDEGTQAGIFDETEQDMVTGIFRLDDMPVKSLMTPRRDMAVLDIHDTHDELITKISESGHSRYPVIDDSPEHIIGVVRASDLLRCSLKHIPINLQALSSPPLFIPESATAADVLALFKRHKQQFGFVIDEEGAIEGIITLHDILEAVIGDISSEPDVVSREDGSFLVDGAMPIETFKDLIEVDELPEEDRYSTLAGFIFFELGKIPTTGDSFIWGNYKFEVMDMDGNRVDKVLIMRHNDK